MTDNDDEPAFIVCTAVADLPKPSRDSVARWCSMCVTEVWMAPTSIALQEKIGAQPVCTPCADGMIAASRGAQVEPVPGAELTPEYREAVGFLRGLWRGKK